MTFIDMFAGIRGVKLGLERASRQFKCVWANDNDKYACQISRMHYPKDNLCEGDIRTTDADAIPEHDLLCAGFPCQSFSIAGKRRGFEDTRGTLFFEICRVIRAKRPSYLLLENVKGLLSHDEGFTFSLILATLDELGYDCQWQVLNSKDYGVPQNRERVFIVGHLRGKPRPKVFPIGEDAEMDTEMGEGEQVTGCISAIQGKMNWASQYAISPPITTEMAHGTGFNQTPQVVKAIGSVRRLTPLECERLQGFPDGWTEGISDTQRYKCLGNAVTVNVIEAIGRRLLDEIQ